MDTTKQALKTNPKSGAFPWLGTGAQQLLHDLFHPLGLQDLGSQILDLKPVGTTSHRCDRVSFQEPLGDGARQGVSNPSAFCPLSPEDLGVWHCIVQTWKTRMTVSQPQFP